MADIREESSAIEYRKHFIEMTASGDNDTAYRDIEQEARGYARLVQALAFDYFSLYYVDIESGRFLEYGRMIDDPRMLLRRKGEDFFMDAGRTIRHLVMPEDQDRLHELVQKENIRREIETGGRLSIHYRRLIKGAPRYVSLRFLKLDDDPGHIVIGLIDIDSQTRREQEYEAQKRESLRFSRIAQTLASDYFTIYYIDIMTNRFMEFLATDQGKKLDTRVEREDFFNWIRKNISLTIFGSYRDKALAAYDRDTILKTLRTEKVYSTTYRKMVGGKTAYINVKAFRMIDEDDRHIVIGLSNIGDRVKREEEYALAQEMALRDPMTGVKNKRAYSREEQRINESIRMGHAEPFAMVVCDINGLKIINDSLGHKAGDEYIKEASNEICYVFTHSPVFRVGGDEFAVILSGQDYLMRHKLLAELQAANQRNIDAGKVVIATGISDFDPEQDKNIAVVFNRADSAMYMDKKRLKGIECD